MAGRLEEILENCDLRGLEPDLRLDRMIRTLKGLQRGESRVFFDNRDLTHDLKDLRSQMDRPIAWEFIEQGPDFWIVRLERRARRSDPRFQAA